MENREAIEALGDLLDTTQKYPHLDGMTMFGDALALAISALEFRERYDKFWEEVKSAGKSGKETEIRHSGRVFRIREVAQ